MLIIFHMFIYPAQEWLHFHTGQASQLFSILISYIYYAEIFGPTMRKHALIMGKLNWIMQKFKQFIELIIRPFQFIYMLMVNQWGIFLCH